jgi:hypothetical protein
MDKTTKLALYSKERGCFPTEDFQILVSSRPHHKCNPHTILPCGPSEILYSASEIKKCSIKQST